MLRKSILEFMVHDPKTCLQMQKFGFFVAALWRLAGFVVSNPIAWFLM